MGKGHRDNHAARVKRGPEAFAKKARRRHPDRTQCLRCGTLTRTTRLTGGLCLACLKKDLPIGGEVSIGETLDIAFSMMSGTKGLDDDD
jgi:hypothetical protein